MFTFANPTLIWGLAIVAAPVLIHLINLVRHRRVKWAAMEFLLASQKKNSSWVRLRELLLLLLRMAVIAAIVLMLAQPLLDRQLGLRLGGQQVQHVVLLDDSFSMSDRWAEATAFDRAKDTIKRLADQASLQTVSQSFTLLRFSRAGQQGSAGQPDLTEVLIDDDFTQKLTATLDPIEASQTAAGPAAALESLGPLLGDAQGNSRIVYVVSDFRAKEWDQPTDLAASLKRLTDRGDKLEFVNCVDLARPNLTIAALAPQRGTRAAGVPLTMSVTVRNFGDQSVKGLTLMLEEDGVARPSLVIDELGPQASETRSFEVFFATAGQHTIAARLPSDTVAADNVRYALVDLPVNVRVLIVDSDPEAASAKYLAAVLAPGGSVKTGIDPRIEQPAWLNANSLAGFQAVYLTNVDRLDHAAVEALEKFVKQGGGLAVFMGERSLTDFYNQEFYRDGEGAFPLPLVGSTQLLVNRLDKGADLVVTDHPVFRVFSGERNSFLSAVTIERFMAAPRDWKPTADSGVEVIARLRNGSPLAVERKFGDGRVLAVLTTAAPTWNNWAPNPSYVVAVLEMQSQVASGTTQNDSRLVGTPIAVTLDPADFQPAIRFIPPNGGESSATVTDAVSGPQGLAAKFPDTATSGVYELQLTRTDNRNEALRYAFNVDPSEGNLATIDGEQLTARRKGVRFTYWRSGQVGDSTADLAGANAGDWVLYLLIAFLVGEQLLAYVASYHPAAPVGARA